MSQIGASWYSCSLTVNWDIAYLEQNKRNTGRLCYWLQLLVKDLVLTWSAALDWVLGLVSGRCCLQGFVVKERNTAAYKKDKIEDRQDGNEVEHKPSASRNQKVTNWLRPDWGNTLAVHM